MARKGLATRTRGVLPIVRPPSRALWDCCTGRVGAATPRRRTPGLPSPATDTGDCPAPCKPAVRCKLATEAALSGIRRHSGVRQSAPTFLFLTGFLRERAPHAAADDSSRDGATGILRGIAAAAALPAVHDAIHRGDAGPVRTDPAQRLAVISVLNGALAPNSSRSRSGTYSHRSRHPWSPGSAGRACA